jgi:uncharacterized protein
MQINLDFTPNTYSVRSYGPGEIIVRMPPADKAAPPNDMDDLPANSQRFTSSFVISPRQLLTSWTPQTMAELFDAHLEQLHELKPELVLLGTGARQIFPAPKLLMALQKYRIGLEIMDTGAACRTYNFLVADGRDVAAALMMIR